MFDAKESNYWLLFGGGAERWWVNTLRGESASTEESPALSPWTRRWIGFLFVGVIRPLRRGKGTERSRCSFRVDCRWIGKRFDNYRETFATSSSAELDRGNRDSGGEKGTIEMEREREKGVSRFPSFGVGSSVYFPNANARNNPYFTSRWHRVVVV